MEGGGGSNNSQFYNRMGEPQQGFVSYNPSNIGQGAQGGIPRVQSAMGGQMWGNSHGQRYSTQVQHQQYGSAARPLLSLSDRVRLSGNANVYAGGGADSEHGIGGPFYQQQRYHHAPPYQQQPHQRPTGFLQQVLRSREGLQVGYPPYGRPRLGSMVTNQPFQMGQQRIQSGAMFQGFRGVGQSSLGGHVRMGGGGAGGQFHFQSPQLAHLQQQLLNNRNFYDGHAGRGSTSCPNYQQTAVGNPMPSTSQQHPPQPSNPNDVLPITRNEPEESVDEQPNREVQQAETRYTRNHERMRAIMNENLVDCTPITVPNARLDSLRNYVQLLEECVEKEEEETKVLEETYAKKLEDVKASNEKFHSDYNKLCEPMTEEEYDALVEKYYVELKENLRQSKKAKINVDDGLASQQENGSAPPSPSSLLVDEGNGAPPEMENGENRLNEEVVTRDNEKFDHPLTIDIPKEENDGMNFSPHLLQQQGQFFENQDPMGSSESFPTHSSVQCRGFPSDSDMYLGAHYLNQQQSQHYHHQLGASSSTVVSDQMQMSTLVHHPPYHPSHSQHQMLTKGHQVNPNFAFQSFAEEQYSAHPPHQPYGQGFHQHPSQMAPANNAPSAQVRNLVFEQAREKRRWEQTLSPQQPQFRLGSPRLSTSSIFSTGHDGQVQQRRRFLSGGGIVEVKQPTFITPPQQGCSLYGNEGTQDWINQLTANATTTGSNDDAPAAEILQGQEETADDSDNKLQNDPQVTVDESPPPVSNPSADNIIRPELGEHSKIVEILNSPCLNSSSAEAFESELKKLEDSLNGNEVETAITTVQDKEVQVGKVKPEGDEDADDNDDDD